MSSLVLKLICLSAVALSLMACGRMRSAETPVDQTPTSATNADAERDLPFGNPSHAGRESDNYLLVHGSYTLSYNNSRGTLNWIAWRTTRRDLAQHRDRSLFEPDKSLPDGFRRVQYYDYSGSGYDRGHMVPSADRFADEARNRETFLMTNIVPQSKDLNQYPWNDLEKYARSFAYRGSEIYTIAGVYGEKSRLRGRVAVPTNCWKVIVVFDKAGAYEISPRTRVIAVDMPNEDNLENISWSRYVTTVDEIEAKTGLDLFDLLPDDLECAIESKRAAIGDR